MKQTITLGAECMTIVPSQSSLPLDTFVADYESKFGTPKDQRHPRVFTDPSSLVAHLAGATRISAAHNTCIDTYGTFCVHYRNADDAPRVAALYGFKQED